MQNDNTKDGKAKVKIVIYTCMTLNVAAFLLILIFANSIWQDVNKFMRNATGISVDWVIVILIISILLIVNYGLKSFFCLRRIKRAADAKKDVIQLIFVPIVFILWNAMTLVMIQEAGDYIVLAQLKYFSRLVAPWLFLAIAAGLIWKLLAGRQNALSIKKIFSGTAALLLIIWSVIIFSGWASGETTSNTSGGDRFFDEQIVFNSVTDANYATYRIPGIIVTPEGTVILYCEAREGYDDWANIDVYIKRSTDDGSTWEKPQLMYDGGDGTVNNPVMIAENNSETVHFVYCIEYKRCFYRRSMDAGVTWSETVEITSAFENFKASYTWEVIATGPGHGIQLQNGRLVIPVWLSLGTSSDGHHPSIVSTIYSDDGGETWHGGEIVPSEGIDNPNETAAVELADGSVMLNMRNEEYSSDLVYRAVTISPNGATGWSRPVQDKALYDPICFGSLHRYDSNTIVYSGIHHRLKTNFALTFLNLWGPREPLGIRVSFDDGKTWPIEKICEKNETGYSDIFVRDGIIYLLFEQGWRKMNKYRTKYLRLYRFNLEWVMHES